MLHSLDSGFLTRDAIQAELDAMLRLDGEGTGELLLIRHAQPARSSNQDPMLSCRGLEQAERLAERLRDTHIEAIFTAPERRAQQTARLLSEAGRRPLHILGCLGELAFEPPEAMLSRTSYGERFAETSRWSSLPGFEAGHRFRRRVVHAIDRARGVFPGTRIAVVAHASVINAYLAALLAIPADQFFAPDHASVTPLRWRDGRFALRALNDLSHLSQAPRDEAVNQPFYPAFTPVNNPLNQAT